jgi:phospholipase C
VVETFGDRLSEYGKLSWETMPQALLSAGVSWKVYNDPTGLLGLSPLPYFKAFNNPLSLTGLELIARGLTPSYPGTFASDVASGSLPSVSWIIPPLAECEHPAAPPEYGEYLVQQILNTPNLSAWRRSVTGDFTGALNFTAPPVTAVPSLPSTSLGDTTVAEEAVLNALAGTLDVGIPYPLPASNSMPSQATTPARPNVP